MWQNVRSRRTLQLLYSSRTSLQAQNASSQTFSSMHIAHIPQVFLSHKLILDLFEADFVLIFLAIFTERKEEKRKLYGHYDLLPQFFQLSAYFLKHLLYFFACLQVGMLYCRDGQQTEEDMYNNEEGGPAFNEFLDLIGQRVRLKGFNRYKAGLCNKGIRPPLSNHKHETLSLTIFFMMHDKKSGH